MCPGIGPAKFPRGSAISCLRRLPRQGNRAVRSTAPLSVRPVRRIRSLAHGLSTAVNLAIRRGVRRTYRYRLYPTGRQERALDLQLGKVCDLYNAALEHRRTMWREYGMSVTYREQSAELKDMRADGLLDASANFWSQQAVLKRLDRAFRRSTAVAKRARSPATHAFALAPLRHAGLLVRRQRRRHRIHRRGPAPRAGRRAHQGQSAPPDSRRRRAVRGADRPPQRPLVCRDQPQRRAGPPAGGDRTHRRRGSRDHDVRRDERR